MAQANLRGAQKAKVMAILEKSYFSQYNYEVRFDGLDENVLLQIVFVPRPEFYFIVKKKTPSVTLEFVSTECPGEDLVEPVAMKRESFYACISALEDWIKRILADFRSSNPIAQELKDFRETILKDLDAHIKDPQAHFSKEEAEEMKGKMDLLSSKLQELREANKIADADLKRLREEVEQLKADLKTFPKGAWIKTAGAKVYDMLTKVLGSKEGRELVFNTTKMLTQGHHSDNPPQ